MRYYTKILVWENSQRLEKLKEFRGLVLQYFNNSRYEWMADARIEENAASQARVRTNRIIDDVHNIILSSGINPSIAWAPPPSAGGYVKRIDVIQNIFNLVSCQW